MATHSSVLAWEISWTEEPGGLQSVESQSWTWLGTWAQKQAKTYFLFYCQPCSQSTSLLLGLLLQPSAWSLSIYKLTSLQFILHIEPGWFFFQCEIISHSSLNSFNCFPSQLVWDSDSFSLSQEPSRIQTLSVSGFILHHSSLSPLCPAYTKPSQYFSRSSLKCHLSH